MDWPQRNDFFFDNWRGSRWIEANHFFGGGKGNLRVSVEHVDNCRVFPCRTYFRQWHSIPIFVTAPSVQLEWKAVFQVLGEQDGEMTDTARPAQTGRYRSVSPSSATS
jgi:hypothetical protein